MRERETNKEKILYLLEKRKGAFISGEEIGESLQITRAAVWKSITQLREEGHQIESKPRMGYSLKTESDVITEQGIRLILKESIKEIPIYHYQQVDSTNSVAKKLALEGSVHGTVVIAEYQSGGMGRRGRSFYSPSGSGVYLSLILRPQLDAHSALKVTSAAAVATCRAIEESYNLSTKIKWVNDIFLNNRKVGGILTEGASGFENGKIESIVVGIGVNITDSPKGFPSELSNIATSLFGKKKPPASRNHYIAALINTLFFLIADLDNPSIMREYKERSFVIGKEVMVIQGEITYKAVVKDITDEGALVVESEAKGIHTLQSGEISLGPTEGLW